jgi:uncharacterized membrane protein YphA (DoxX/SURF4 family)
MDIVLWILQVILALFFVAAGYQHGVAYEKSRQGAMAWLNALSIGQARTIAVLESLGGLGLVLPAATGVLSWLTPTAAALLALLMGFAIVFHARRAETRNIAFTAFWGVLALVIAYGRFVLEPL